MPRTSLQNVLGIDAAWTERQPSGVALAGRAGPGWRLVAANASYDAFHARAGRAGTGLVPDAAALLASARVLAEGDVDLVAIDMPLSLDPITMRRESDNAVSRCYGGRKAGTHTPSALSPGPLSDRLRAGFADAGYGLCTAAIARPGLIEVYPHPALIELTGAAQRLPYKAGKTKTYHPGLGRADRVARLLATWASIVGHLEAALPGAAAALPVPAHPTKAFEDTLDAVVCALVAARALDGQARAFGDARSAIWVPLGA